jgi:serine/threonine-protein kinase
LVRKLGAGGMGSVWLAHDTSLDSPVALKLIDDDKAKSEEVRVRFAREAKAAAQLRGAHVVDVFDHGDSDGTLYIAMEYLQGEDLGARLDRVGRLDVLTTYRVVAHVARALVRAHANGIVHRDLKPENIFLVQNDEEEIAKVLDFGIAKLDAYSLQDKATRTGSFLGTPFYVSPEQARGKSTDYRSDLWSLGIIVFQCLTGRPPFESEALGELMGLILYEDLPRLTAHNPELPATIDAWWERAAMRDRELRFQSAKELADALGHALGVGKVVAIPTIAPRRPSMSDGTGNFPTATSSGSFPPAPGLPNLNRTPNSLLPSFSDPEWTEERVETDAPVSRTRHSAVPGLGLALIAARLPRKLRPWLTKKGLKKAFASFRAQPKKVLVPLGITTGVLLGVILALVFFIPGPEQTAERRPSPVATTAAAPSPASKSGLAADSAMATSQAVPQAPSVTVPIVSPEPTPESSGAASKGGESAEPRKKVAPAPVKRRVVRGPDYGI